MKQKSKSKMKVDVYDVNGNKIEELELPKYFKFPFREDIINKTYEILKLNAKHPYTNYPLAGKDSSASSKVRHGRGQYMSVRGKGMSRVPRKILLRRKPQGFYWVGAFIASARGGLRAHPPKIKSKLKINKKEKFLAFLSALSAVANKDLVIKRYARLASLKTSDKIKMNFPIIIKLEEKIEKTKTLKDILTKIFSNQPELIDIVFKKKKIRAGKGKLRGRRYKSSAGLLLVTAKDEIRKMKTAGMDIIAAEKLSIKDLAKGNQPARLTAFTTNSLKELDKKIKQQAEKLKINLDI